MKNIVILTSLMMLVATGAFAKVTKRSPSSNEEAIAAMKSLIPAGTRAGTITVSPGDGFVTPGMECSITATYNSSVNIHLDVPKAQNGDNYEDVYFPAATSTITVNKAAGSTRFIIQMPGTYKDEDGTHHFTTQKVVVQANGTVTAGPDFSCKPN